MPKTINEMAMDYLTSGYKTMKPYSESSMDWYFPSPAGGITTSVAVPVKAAVVGMRNYITGLDIANSSLTGTDVVILDGATVMWRIPVNGMMAGRQLTFPTPVKGSVNSALSVQCLTAGGAVYVNLQGYTGP